MFQPFDPQADTKKSRRKLPHWRQKNVTYFVTTRLADSIPHDVIMAWIADRNRWLRANGFESIDALSRASELQRSEYYRRFTAEWHRLLDLGAGNCLLREVNHFTIVGDSLRHFDGVKYDLDSFVVMPNHVHLLLTPTPAFDLSDILRGWKTFTARLINQRLGRMGALWQSESFNHIVRSAEQLQRFRQYIAENPMKARLRPGTFLLWQKDRRRRR